jgi:hypothetical protein
MKPYLDCNIISVMALSNTPDYFYQIDNIYHYNSLTSGIINFKLDCIQIPEFEIRDKHLLNNLDFDLIDRLNIPIIKRVIEDNEYWKIDLKYYENYKLQSENI